MDPSLSLPLFAMLIVLVAIVLVLWILLPFAVFGVKPMLKAATSELSEIRRSIDDQRQQHKALEAAVREQTAMLRAANAARIARDQPPAA